MQKLILMGTGPFAVPTFAALQTAGHQISLVVTRPRPAVKSRGGAPPSPVRDWADNHQLAIFDPDSINDPQAIQRLKAERADLLVVCDYGQILKPAALETARLGGINLHGSLLPKYRGAAPVQWSLLAGDRVTGVSVIHMTPRLDGGPILTSRTAEIHDDETAGELEARLSEVGVEATLEAIEILSTWDGMSPIGQAQDTSQATKAPRLKKSDGLIDWTRTARQIDCHVRGMQPWPVAFTYLPVSMNKPPLRLAIREITVLADRADSWSPGELVDREDDPGLVVAASDQLLRIDRLQPAGKQVMSGEDFLRGHQPPAGACLGGTPQTGS